MHQFLLLLVFLVAPGFSAGHAQSPGRVIAKSATCAPPNKMGEVRVACVAACPTGSKILGGGCMASGARLFALSVSRKQANGWVCNSYDPLTVGNGNAKPEEDTRLTAEAYCESRDVTPPAKWESTSDGTLVAIARDGSGFNQNIPLGFSVCNMGSIDPVDVGLVARDGSLGTPDRPEYIAVAPGKCLLTDQPRSLFIINHANQLRTIGGTYQAFQPGVLLPSGSKPFDIVDFVEDSTAPVAGAPVLSVEAECRKVVPRPTPAKNIYSVCKITALARGANYRICFGKTYTPPQDNGDNYPGGYVPMVLGRELLDKPMPATPNQAFYNPVTMESCRDIYAVTEASFIVWPWRTDPADKTWKPEKVSKVSLTVQALPATSRFPGLPAPEDNGGK